MKIPTIWSIYKKVRLSIQNSGATALAGKGILEGYLRHRAAPAAVLPFNSLAGKGGYERKHGMRGERIDGSVVSDDRAGYGLLDAR